MGTLVVLVGERPGLSAADSLGACLTHAPEVGRRDSGRNSVSNIRAPHGLSYERAADVLLGLVPRRRRSLASLAQLSVYSGADRSSD